MLSRARLRGAERLGEGSFNPRNEGPLIEGRLSAGGSTRAGLVGSLRVAVNSAVVAFGVETGTAACWAAGSAGPARSEAPHMPQKRFWPGFSLPQRGQRTQNLLHL